MNFYFMPRSEKHGRSFNEFATKLGNTLLLIILHIKCQKMTLSQIRLNPQRIKRLCGTKTHPLSIYGAQIIYEPGSVMHQIGKGKGKS
jgi:hypothetical protein